MTEGLPGSMTEIREGITPLLYIIKMNDVRVGITPLLNIITRNNNIFSVALLPSTASKRGFMTEGLPGSMTEIREGITPLLYIINMSDIRVGITPLLNIITRNNNIFPLALLPSTASKRGFMTEGLPGGMTEIREGITPLLYIIKMNDIMIRVGITLLLNIITRNNNRFPLALLPSTASKRGFMTEGLPGSMTEIREGITPLLYIIKMNDRRVGITPLLTSSLGITIYFLLHCCPLQPVKEDS